MKSFRTLFQVAVLVIGSAFPLFNGEVAQADYLHNSMVRFDRMKTSSPSTGTVCAKPSTTSSDVKSWTVTFPSGYTVNAGSNWQGGSKINTTDYAWPAGGTPWPNATSATASVAGQTVTWTNASPQTMNNTTLYCYNWITDGAVTITASTGSSLVGTITTKNSSSAGIDSADFVTAAVSDDSVEITALLPEMFVLTLSNVDDQLGTLNPNSVNSSPTPPTAQIDTNALNGWQVWALENNSPSGLHSAIPYTIASTAPGGPRTLSAGTTDINMGVSVTRTDGTGSYSADAAYDWGSIAGRGGGIDTTPRSIASSNGTAQAAIVTIRNNVAISGMVPAAFDYKETITLIGAGLF